jgi:hypothetical protein
VTAVLEAPVMARPDYAPARLSLGDAFRLFLRFPTPRILIPVVAAEAVARVALGGWTWTDLVIPAVILALEPFTEWVIHVFLLHFRPRTVFGVHIDPLAARKHRAHHRDPKFLPLIFVPLPVLVIGLVVGAALFLAFSQTLRLALTGILAADAMLLTYEWTHYLIHSTYRPKTRYYRSIWRAHRLHHYRNERYWFGVTVNVGDRVLRTYPAKDAVPLSDTAQDLNGEGQWTGDDRAVAAHAARGRRA